MRMPRLFGDRNAGVVVIVPLGEASVGIAQELAALEVVVHAQASYYDDFPWSTEHFERSLPFKREYSLVAMRDDQAVGFLIASERDSGPHVHRLAVAPYEQGRGVASLLLAHFLATTTGAEISVNCDPRNASAVALYEKAGFRKAGHNSDGKLLLTTSMPRHVSELRIWYVFTGIGMSTGHAAHLPALVDAMAEISRTSSIQYGDTADLLEMTFSPAWFRSFVRLVLRARRERVDVMFVRIHWKLAGLLWLASKFGGRWKVVLWSSGGVGFRAGTRLPRRERIMRRLHRRTLRSFIDALATGPPTVRDEYASRYSLPSDHLLLASNDVDLETWGARSQTDPSFAGAPVVQEWLSAPHRLLYVHGLDELRGGDRLPSLFRGLTQRLEGARLLVLGDGPLLGELQGQGLSLAGRVSNVDVAWAMSRASCLLVPSRQEGFPRVLVEAMALGTPAVAFDVGGCADVFGSLAPTYVARDGDIDQMIELAADVCLAGKTATSQVRLRNRAESFETRRVASILVASLRSLRTQGPAAASWTAGALWQPDFPTKENHQ